MPDAAAAAAGIAVLDWSDARRTAVGWRVVVRRGDVALPWTPSSAAGAAEVHRTRSAASGRAHDVSLDLRVEGPVALWSHPDIPVLATAALVDPERMLRRIAAVGLPMDDMHVVVTPHRPVACAGPGDRRAARGGDPRGQRHAAVAGPRRPPLDLTLLWYRKQRQSGDVAELPRSPPARRRPRRRAGTVQHPAMAELRNRPVARLLVRAAPWQTRIDVRPDRLSASTEEGAQ